MNKTLIHTDHLSLSYGNTSVLHDVTVSIGERQFVLFTGPNGGGKTTLVRLMLGLLSPTAGQIVRRDGLVMGYLPQYQRLDRQFPIAVEDVVLSGLLCRKKPFAPFTADQRQHVRTLLKEMKLEGFEQRAVSELSGGQLQRVLFARAVVSEPDLLILDEPDTYLDHSFQAHLALLLEQYAQRCAVVLVTHNPHGIERLASDIWRIDGTVQAVDRTNICAHHAGHVDGHC